MSNIINEVGNKHGRLTVLRRAEKNKHNEATWVCECDCGNVIEAIGSHLRSGNTKSCGCIGREKIIERNKTHGLSHFLLYKTWTGMKQRCYNENSKVYKYYGGRGIKVCDRWLNSFENFYEDMENKPKGMTIDRIDNDGNYEPGNCRWATKEQQSNNTSSNRLLNFNGRTQTMFLWAKELGLKYSTLRSRLNLYGWSVEKALTIPIKDFHKLESTETVNDFEDAENDEIMSDERFQYQVQETR